MENYSAEAEASAARQPRQASLARSDTENNLHFNWQLLENNYGVEEMLAHKKQFQNNHHCHWNI